MSAASMVQEQSYNPREAAAIIRAHPQTVRRMIARGEIEYFMVGREYRIRKSVLEAFMANKGTQQEKREPAEV